MRNRIFIPVESKLDATHSVHTLNGTGYPQYVKVVDAEAIISEVEDMRPYNEAGNRDSYSEYSEGWSDACDIISSKLNKQ